MKKKESKVDHGTKIKHVLIFILLYFLFHPVISIFTFQYHLLLEFVLQRRLVLFLLLRCKDLSESIHGKKSQSTPPSCTTVLIHRFEKSKGIQRNLVTKERVTII